MSGNQDYLVIRQSEINDYLNQREMKDLQAILHKIRGERILVGLAENEKFIVEPVAGQ